MHSDLSSYEAVLLDLDGTIYSEDHPLPGAIELLQGLMGEGRTFACLTNSTDSPQRLAARLGGMGAPVDAGHIYTAAAATADYVLDLFKRPRVFDLVTEGMRELLAGKVEWVEEWGEEEAAPAKLPACDVVICGNPQCKYATPHRQHVALQLLRDRAALVGVCADRVYPSPRGIEIGSGALTEQLAYAANVEPTFCGKPEGVFFAELCRRLKVDPRRCLLVGDNVETDIVGANRAGMGTVLVLTGVTRRKDLSAYGRDYQPGRVIETLAEL